ncbi:uncharacterized protein LOC129592083 isoform X2 [Paramacrobiotus metropolitanus]|uniref:uncharacterized protein LOC129592083 isoform X2 n=1 Tax=Paramacrobiotus metropolitanus TaxID=2943436 RepID=UPI002445C05A|nr:uncharacterized protein LOC129592083 isoform X2 [Paramacrobiotus metropolitanus]
MIHSGGVRLRCAWPYGSATLSSAPRSSIFPAKLIRGGGVPLRLAWRCVTSSSAARSPCRTSGPSQIRLNHLPKPSSDISQEALLRTSSSQLALPDILQGAPAHHKLEGGGLLFDAPLVQQPLRDVAEQLHRSQSESGRQWAGLQIRAVDCEDELLKNCASKTHIIEKCQRIAIKDGTPSSEVVAAGSQHRTGPSLVTRQVGEKPVVGFLAPSLRSRSLCGATTRTSPFAPKFIRVRGMSGICPPEMPIFQLPRMLDFSIFVDLKFIIETVKELKVDLFRRSLQLRQKDTVDVDSATYPVEVVVAALKRGEYEAVREEVERLSNAAAELSMRQRVQLSSACLLALMVCRSRLKVFYGTLAAPGDMSDASLSALEQLRDAEVCNVRGLVKNLDSILQSVVAGSRVPLDDVLKPLLFCLWSPLSVFQFVGVLDVAILSIGHLISGYDGELTESVDMIKLPVLVRDLEQVAALIEANELGGDVQFAVGKYGDYSEADWHFFDADYQGPVRITVHMGWVYAVVHSSDVHGIAIGELIGAVMEQLKRRDFIQVHETNRKYEDRLGCGIIHTKKNEQFVIFAPELGSTDIVVAFEVAFANETLIVQFIQASNFLGPETSVQYVIDIDISYDGRSKNPFWATLYVFRRMPSPRAKKRHNPADGKCDNALKGEPVGSGHDKFHLLDGKPVYNKEVMKMTRDDIRRVFDIDLVMKHHVDDSNLTEPVEVHLEIVYPDGYVRPFTVLLDRLFPRVKIFWEKHFAQLEAAGARKK